MKSNRWAVAIISTVFMALPGRAQTGLPANAATSDSLIQALSDYQVTERGRHHRVWERFETVQAPDGTPETRHHKYTELKSCMYFPRNGLWAESNPAFTLTNGCAIATECAHQVIVAPTLLDSAGVVDLQTPDGKRLRALPIALVLSDPVTGTNVQVGIALDASAVQTAPNEVTFSNAFDGLKANVRVRNEVGGAHQDILLAERITREQLAGLGFPDPSRVRLEIWTEFLQAPDPVVTEMQSQSGDPGDQRLDFGTMAMRRGWAFVDATPTSTNQASGLRGASFSRARSVPVSKRWAVDPATGRRCLVESVNFGKLLPLLSRLPAAGTASLRTKRIPGKLIAERMPARPPSVPRKSDVEIARLDPSRRSPGEPLVVCDYALLGDENLTNYTFAPGTYLVAGIVLLEGTTTISGDAIIKFSSQADSPGLQLDGPLVCQTAPYRYAVLTSSDDNLCGETITGSSGTPGLIDATYLYYQDNPSQTYLLSYLRMAYAFYGFCDSSEATQAVSIQNCQFVNCDFPAVSLATAGSLTVENTLFSGCAYPVWPSVPLAAINVTAIGCTNFSYWMLTPPSLALTNCLIDGGALPGSTVLDHTFRLSSTVGVFQSVGAANYYLPAGSAYHNAGTTNVDPALLSNLTARTTWAPAYLTNGVFGPFGAPGTQVQVNLAPVAPRDTSPQPDIGYHYDPIDYLANSWQVTNAVVTIQPGTVVAWCFNNGAGLWLDDNASIVSQGSALQPVLFTPYPSAQEQSLFIGSPRSGAVAVNPYRSNGITTNGIFRFTTFNLLQGDYYSFSAANQSAMTPLLVQDCVFHGGYFNIANFTGPLTLQNNLFDLSLTPVGQVSINSAAGLLTARNNLVRNGRFRVNMRTGASSWVVEDNLFDTTTNAVAASVASDYNAYYNCSFSSGYTTNIHELILTNLSYDSTKLGTYYQAGTNLLGMGSQSAAAAGLYHYTTRTNEIPEGNSTVAIGLHYVAVDANGRPLDTNGDGVPDYVEDADGNGEVNGGEVDWKVLPNGASTIPGLIVFTPWH